MDIKYANSKGPQVINRYISKEWSKEGSWKAGWHDDIQAKNFGFYESLNEAANSNGIYSLKDGWLKKPVKDDIPDTIDLEPELSEWIRKYEDCNSINSIDNFMDDIYKLRQESLLSEGEYGKGNQIFKELRNRGVLQDLKDKKVELENKDMSLESLEKDDLDETIAKLKDKYNRTLDWYHRYMENGSLPGEYDRNNPIINEDLIARASNKFGFSSDKLRRALKGEDIWK